MDDAKKSKRDCTKWMDTKTAAAELDCSVMTVIRMVDDGTLEGADVGAGPKNRSHRINPQSIRQFKITGRKRTKK